MNEIKPVYQVRTVPHGWQDIPKEKYQNALDNLEIEGRILYPAAAYEALYKENAEQERKIISLENELVKWNEFKKIRDAQMQALRKQMP